MKPLFAVVPLLILSAAIPPPLTAAATTADFGNYGARPEWYILPLHTLLEAFQSKNPKLAFIGTMVIPGIILVVILGLPWFDKKPRTPTVTGAISLVAAVGLLASVIPSAGLIAPVTRQPIVTASNLPASNKPAETFSAALVAAGQKEYTDQGCSDCHKMDGKGETNGPDLTHEATRHADLDWQMRHLRAPKEVTPGSTMPPFARIGDEKIKNLAIYLISKK
jgi:mono/diheme cytochrome c family protein